MKWIIFILLGVTVKAETPADIRDQLEQLKTNVENSDFNLKQYTHNLDTVKANLRDLDQALDKLTKMRRQVDENTKHAAMNNTELDQHKIVINTLIGKEQSMIESEARYIMELKAKMEKLQANQKKRQENIVGYKKRLEQIAEEKIEWADQRKNAQQILTQVAFKESQLREERKTWAAKESDYRTEVSKWSQEATSAKNSYKNYRKLSSE